MHFKECMARNFVRRGCKPDSAVHNTVSDAPYVAIRHILRQLSTNYAARPICCNQQIVVHLRAHVNATCGHTTLCSAKQCHAMVRLVLSCSTTKAVQQLGCTLTTCPFEAKKEYSYLSQNSQDSRQGSHHVSHIAQSQAQCSISSNNSSNSSNHSDRG